MSNRQSKRRIMVVILSVAFAFMLTASPLAAYAAPATGSQVSLGSEYPLSRQLQTYLANSDAAAAEDSVPIPTNITAVYMTPLSRIELPDGFAWATDAPQDLGSVGTKEVAALYTRPGTTDSAISCTIPVQVTPMPGSDCSISPITSESEADNCTITAPNGYTLQKGTDYTVASTANSATITFLGNFSGSESRTYGSSTGNEWVAFPKIANWMYGQTPAAPVAEARFGTPEFAYNVGDAWGSEPPTQPGHYTLRVTVPGTAQYAQLTEDVPFTVYEAIAPSVDGLAAVYRENLTQVSLPEGFEWQNPTELVGNVGEQKHIAFYTSEPESLYQGGILSLSVTVKPKDGQACTISPITNEYESKHVVITDGDYILQEGLDYSVRNVPQESAVDVFIDFTGNYYGSAERAYTFGPENSWAEPVRISNWFAGQEPSVPEAEALYGTAQFSYLVNGSWQSAPPTAPGTYTCRAIVPATQYYDQIESETTFTVYADDAPTVPVLTATYGTRLYDIALPTGYAWSQPQQFVGDVGVNRFSATYTATGTSTGIVVELSMRVTPKDGSLCTISPIQNQYDAQHITVTDGLYKLVKGKDYVITWNLDGNIVQIDIAFKGNYTGTVQRSFRLNQTNDWVVPLSISSWCVGETPVKPIAEPLYGEATFSYLVDGEWQADPPTEEGSYQVRALVPASQYYGSLSATLSFQILSAGESEGAKLQAVADSAVEVRNEKGVGRTLIGRGLTATRTGNTVSELLLMVESNPHSADYIMEVVDEDNTPQDAATTVCTGYKLWLIDMTQNGRVVDEVTIVVLGDVLAEGTVNLSQVVRMAEAFRNPLADPLEGPLLLAGDFYRTGAVALTDLVFEAQLYQEAMSEEEI